MFFPLRLHHCVLTEKVVANLISETTSYVPLARIAIAISVVNFEESAVVIMLTTALATMLMTACMGIGVSGVHAQRKSIVILVIRHEQEMSSKWETTTQKIDAIRPIC